jgi:hypothetical protein
MLYIVTPELCGIGFLFLDVSEGVKANHMFYSHSCLCCSKAI